jgi:aldehyde:ferredoxin oxidoreductase
MTADEAMDVGRRVVNVLLAFNVRHGITPEVEKPSLRYGSMPVDGPNKGKDIGLEWEAMLDNYHELMGWDRKSGKPRPETLKKYGLERQLKDLW